MSPQTTETTQIRTLALTTSALVAFAANSVLCRLALGDTAIDATSFSTIRLISGAVALGLVLVATGRRNVARERGTWLSASMLFLYAIAFSFAYLSLSAGTGALILFGVVQATMILAGLISGERPHILQWLGLVIAVAGLVYLVFPGLAAPSPLGAALMALAGVAWGVYSLRGRKAGDPIAATTHNFLYAVPLALIASLVMRTHIHLSAKGVLLALVSGALTSGIGYVIWYAALRGLTATRAALVQLVVPALAAVGGVLFLSEAVTIRLFISAVAILGGVILAMSVNGQVLRPAKGK